MVKYWMRSSIIGLFLLLCFCMNSSAKDDDLFVLVPKDAMAVVSVNNLDSDEGLSYITKLWRTEIDRRITMGYQDYKKRRYIDKIYATAQARQVVGAFFKGEDEKNMPYVLILRVKDDPEQLKGIEESIERLIRKQQEPMRQKYSGREIVYVLDRYPQELSAYVGIGNTIIVGTNVNLVKKIIDTIDHKGELIINDDAFTRMRDKFSQNRDIFIFVNNKNDAFTKSMKRWEEKNGVKLLLSSGSLDTLGVSFDVEDSNSSQASIIFSNNSKEGKANIQDDISFLNEVIKRKLMAEKLAYSSEILTEGDYTLLNIKIGDTKMFWQKVFGPKNQEILGRGRGDAKGAGQEAGSKFSVVKMLIIVVVAVVFFVLILKNVESDKGEE